MLLERADPQNAVHLTHQGLATAIGSAREVVSRRLEALRARGLVELDRGVIRLCNVSGLEALAVQE